jgi:hypothetical protein
MNSRKAARLGSTKTRAPYQREGDELQIQSNLAQQPVGMNHSYDDLSANHHSEASLMPSSNRGTFNYNTAWGNQAWDLNGRPTEFFGEQSSNMNQATYGFQSVGERIMSYVDRIPPILPTYKIQPQSNNNLSTLPNGLSGITLATDATTSQDGRPVPMTIPSNGLYNISPSECIVSTHFNEGTPGLKRPKSEASATSAVEMALDEMDIENLPTGSTIGEKRKVTDYYRGALREVGQRSCRTLARAFIRFIEPHKRSNYPYNGGKPPPGSASGTKGDPEKTKPEWWPLNVPHKEPDNMKQTGNLFYESIWPYLG